MNNQSGLRCLSLFCQLLREPSEKRNHEFHGKPMHDITKSREMVLVTYEITWTFGLCSFYFLSNAVTVKSFAADKKKDLVYVSDGRIIQKSYTFEDFFWTGSEDDAEVENSINNQTELEISLVEASPLETWRTTTVFHTTTILFATVYPNSENCLSSKQSCTPKISPVQTRSIEFSLPTLIPGLPPILPCPTQNIPQTDSFDFSDVYPNQDEAEGRKTTESEGSSTAPTLPKGSGNGSVPREIQSNDHNVTVSTVFPNLSLDQQYWISTILRNDNFSRNLELSEIESKLSTLYKKALRRRQEKYFGGNDFYERKDRKLSQQVKVNILNVTRSGRNIELLYYVSVADQPVPAMSAANDMRLITASEVIAELGYPILTKAEPYLKNVVPLGARVKGRTRDTWLFVGSIIAAVLLLIILAALFALELSKKRSKQSVSKELGKRKLVFEEEKGSSNLAFEGETDAKASAKSSRSEPRTGNLSSEVAVKFNPEERRESTSSSCSSSEASLVRLRHQQRRREMRIKEAEGRPKPKPRTRVRKVENSDYSKNYKRTTLDRNDSAISRNTVNQVAVEGYDESHFSPRPMRSPTSYLSMPSVRAFPRGTQIPESLNKILEPISIRHLDADSDSPNEYPYCSQIRHKVDVEHVCEVKNIYSKRKALTRHASLEGDDPGFIGPVVWNRHCQNVEGETIADEIDVEETDETVSVGRMRKRFNELLDDALNMFSSRNPSPEGTEVRVGKQTENRVYSAAVRPAGAVTNIVGSRPKTTGSKRPQSAVILGPRGAWETPSCSTLVRSDNAAVFQKLPSSPNIDKNLIYVNSDLAPSDPAVPVIAAIKNELKKFREPSNENSS